MRSGMVFRRRAVSWHRGDDQRGRPIGSGREASNDQWITAKMRSESSCNQHLVSIIQRQYYRLVMCSGSGGLSILNVKQRRAIALPAAVACMTVKRSAASVYVIRHGADDRLIEVIILLRRPNVLPARPLRGGRRCCIRGELGVNIASGCGAQTQTSPA